MDRRKFIKRIAGAAVATVAVPSIVAAAATAPEIPPYYMGVDPVMPGSGVMVQMQQENMRYYTILTGEKGMRNFHKAMQEYQGHYNRSWMKFQNAIDNEQKEFFTSD